METNPLYYIRLKCLDCCADQPNEVKLCPVTDCALWNFRLGNNPFRKKSTRVYTEEEKAALRSRLAEANKNRQKKQ